MMQSDNIAELNTALARAQGVMEAAKLDKTNPHYRNKYGSLASIWDAIRLPLSINGLSVTQTTEIRDGIFMLVTTLRHSSGQWLTGEYPLPLTGTAQQIGSAMTYAKRYSLSSIAGVVADEDDDAEGAGDTKAVHGRKNGPNALLSEEKISKAINASALISEEQMHSLESAIEVTNASLNEFLRWARVSQLADIKAENYQQCLNAVPNFGEK